MQIETRRLWFQSKQMRPESRIVHQIIHSREAHLNVRALRIELNVNSRFVLCERLAILQEVNPHRLLRVLHAKA